uniref:Uncharacterized protein n=1 Tax=Ciona savignyi TaxID=51511 RepID=H2YC55_CIOSA
CNGTSNSDQCDGPNYRVCCLPGESVLNAWTQDDQHCLEKRGKCQHSSSVCNGAYQENICGGPNSRQCCIPATAATGAKGSNKPHAISKSAILLIIAGLLLIVVLTSVAVMVSKKGYCNNYKRVSEGQWYTRNDELAEEAVKLTTDNDINYA